MDNRWSPEQRAAQAEVIRRCRPWEKSTGPQTAEGKARVGKNAIKRGLQSREARALQQTLAGLLAQTQAAINEAKR